MHASASGKVAIDSENPHVSSSAFQGDVSVKESVFSFDSL
jgi:hypothetical protein